MRSLIKRHTAVRVGVTTITLILFSLLAGCVPTFYPEPLADPACWEVIVSEPALDYGSETFDEEPQNHWVWDGVSERAVYYGYSSCVESSGQWTCNFSAEWYARLCELPEPVVDLQDGSLNENHAGRPVAVYPDPLSIWGIDPWTGAGQQAFTVTAEQIAGVGIPAEVPVLIAEGINPYTDAAIQLYRLPTGEFQINTWYVGGKPYVITWNEGSTEITTLDW